MDKERRQRPSPDARIDRLPPHSPEAEQGVLGCCLLENNVLGTVVQVLKEGPEAMYDLKNQVILKTMIELWDDRDPVDLISLSERLQAWGQLEEVGGVAYLQTLPDAVPSAANLEYYLGIVREKYLLRRMIQACTQTVSKIYETDETTDIDTILDEAERDVLRVAESRVNTDTPPIKDLVRESITEIEDSWQKQGAPTGLTVGFQDFDAMTGGLKPGNMVVVAARPSMGKTSLAMNMAENVVLNLGLPVGVFSLEMTARELTKRMICSRARVNLRSVREGFLAERDLPKITGAAGRIANAPLYIDDTPGLSILQVRAKARRWWQQYGIKLLVIDYLQLMNALGGKRRFESRQQEVSDISHGVKELAKELGIPVVVLSQLNRELERDKNRKPRLADLRESGSIEQDADLVGFLYRPGSGEEEDDDPYADTIAVNLLIAKQRSGPTGDISLTFFKSYTRFETAAKVSDQDVPTGMRDQQQQEFAP